ncbi:MAG: UDP-N-acetylmuramate--L-alanine ligase [Bacteroidales bacterium]|jgi:UDP-N-acetylmuramate--alanine ligase|nr:UDP-N-acetylmuramate--L-alanine ligase [Bacteroidales bacterium]
MIALKNIEYAYFLGIGGIGMSALARYFHANGVEVAGYDRVESPLTKQLVDEGMSVHYLDDPKLIPQKFLNAERCLFVYTPAIPKNHAQKNELINLGFQIYKRAEVLGLLSRNMFTLAVAGTHGKTTVSTMLAWLMQFAETKANAFLGGISKNFNSNYVCAENSNQLVVEADEFDRSFLHLTPNCSIITSTDADHLDIYGTHEELLNTFQKFADSNKDCLVIKQGLQIKTKAKQFHYALDDTAADFYGKNFILDGMFYQFDLQTPDGEICGLKSGVPGLLNCENAIAASAMALMNGLDAENLKKALQSFAGIKRRFEIIVNRPDFVYIDDYAHHPEEIRKTYESLRNTFPGKKLTAIFQPHLYSRTNDFATAFACELSKFDALILLPIYPARELPISGVTSNLIFDQMDNPQKYFVEKSELLTKLKSMDLDVLVSLGAGDIDRFVPQIKAVYSGE